MFYPVDIQVSWWKTALREYLEPRFIQCDIKGDWDWDRQFCTPKTSWWKKKKNLNTKAVLNDWLYRIKKPQITDILALTVLLLQYISWGAQRGSWAHRLMHNGPLHQRPNHKEALGCGWWQKRRGGEEAESVPLRPTWSPGVLMLLHFHMRQHFNKTVQEQLDTAWPTYKNHHHLRKRCYSQWGCILIKSCKANELCSLAHSLHLSAMNDRNKCPVEEHLNKMADMSMWAPHVIFICPGGQNN